MPAKRPPRDTNELAKYILDVTTGEAEKIEPPKKNPHAQALSTLGASKGGQARARTLAASKRKSIAKKAAKVRWGKPPSRLLPVTVGISLGTLKALPRFPFWGCLYGRGIRLGHKLP